MGHLQPRRQFVVQLLSCVGFFPIPWTSACEDPRSSTISQSLLKFLSIESVCNLTFSSSSTSSFCLQSFPASGFLPMRWLLSIRWPKYWSFSISSPNKYSRLISFRLDWFDLLAVQGTLKSLLPYHNLKASVFLALSLLYGPTLTSIHDYWKNHSFDCMELCQQSDVSAFEYRGLS